MGWLDLVVAFSLSLWGAGFGRCRVESLGAFFVD